MDKYATISPGGKPNKLWQYALLIRLNRPIGMLLLLWPMLWALWIAANGPPDACVLCIMIAGVVLMRSAGCAINDFADRDLDPHVERMRTTPAIMMHSTHASGGPLAAIHNAHSIGHSSSNIPIGRFRRISSAYCQSLFGFPPGLMVAYLSICGSGLTCWS